MTKTIAFASAAFALSALLACSPQTAAPQPKTELEANPAPIGMANPASVFCQEIGGQSQIEKDEDGHEHGICLLPNGQVMDEWTLYRAAQAANDETEAEEDAATNPPQQP